MQQIQGFRLIQNSLVTIKFNLGFQARVDYKNNK